MQKPKSMQTLSVEIFIRVFLFAQVFVPQALGNILGRGQGGIAIGYLEPGNDLIKSIDDSIITYGARARIPLSVNTDIITSLAYAELKGETEVVPGVTLVVDEQFDVFFNLGLEYGFAPGQTLRPFIHGAIIYGYSKFEDQLRLEGQTTGLAQELDDDDVGFLGGGGLEINFTQQLSLNTSVDYVDIFDEDDITWEAGLHAWIIESLLASLVGNYGFDSEDKLISISLAVGF